MKIEIPQDVDFILKRLAENNFEAYIVGGCVRDSILGKKPHDWDICTNAKPRQIKECFKDFDQFDAGMKHGTISVVKNGEIFEITTYRIDGEYRDNRRPETVTFTDEITKDLSRRDFTINAMAYNDICGLIDPFNGCADAKNRIIKCVGISDDRFNEDALRIIRALRFASVYNFKIESKTANSILKCRNLLNNIAIERITCEMLKLICGNGVECVLNEYKEVFSVFIPEIEVMFNYNQHNPHHNLDLWKHTTASVAGVTSLPVLRMAMLLHDIGKPKCCTTDDNGENHFYGHSKISSEIAAVVLKRLKLPNEFILECLTLIKFHDVRYSGSPRQIKRLLTKIGECNFRNLLEIQRADIYAQSDFQKEEKLILMNKAEFDFNKIISDNICFSRKQLAVDGKDIIKLGVNDGKQIGNIINTLLEFVIEDKIENNKNALINCAEEIIKNSN